MPISEICSRNVIFVERGETVLQAAKLMRQYNVGALIVAEERDGRRVPVGIVTDRDFTVKIIAAEADPSFIRTEEIMAPELATVKGNCGVFEAIQYMRSKRVRRLPVVDEDGGLIGIVTLDDLLALLAEELSALGRLAANEPKKAS